MRPIVKAITVLLAAGLVVADFRQKLNAAEEPLLPADVSKAEDILISKSLPTTKSLMTISSRGHTGGAPILLIPSGQMKQEDLDAITEDMSVMARIFDKKLGQAHLVAVPGGFFGGMDRYSSPSAIFPGFFCPASRVTEGIYLQGFGVLFFMGVDFPLSAPPKAPEQKKTEEDADEVWAQTKKEIYTPQEVVQKTKKVPTPSQKYDAEKVESLKTTLLKALKHAANIRNLRPDDLLILTVNSQDRVTQSLVLPKIELQGLGDAASSRDTNEVYASSAVKTSFGPSAALTIRAKKSDVDAYSKGDLDLNEFRKKAVMFIY